MIGWFSSRILIFFSHYAGLVGAGAAAYAATRSDKVHTAIFGSSASNFYSSCMRMLNELAGAARSGTRRGPSGLGR